MSSLAPPRITTTELGGAPPLPPLLVGPSLGTSVASLWGGVAARLSTRIHVIGWDLPGHGTNDRDSYGRFDMAALAVGVLRAVESHLAAADVPSAPFGYAGDSVGGAVGLHLLLDAPDRLTGAVLASTGARIGTPNAWTERAAKVRSGGTGALVEGIGARWFAPGFAAQHPDVAARLTTGLRATSTSGYVAVCRALAHHDVGQRLAEIGQPVLAIAGGADLPTPVSDLREIADGVKHGRLVVLPGVGHLPPVEAPDLVAELIGDHFSPLTK